MRVAVIVFAVSVMLAVASARAGQGGVGRGPAEGAPAPIGFIAGRVVDAGTGQAIAEAEVTVTLRPPVPASPMPAGPAGGMSGAAQPSVRLLTGPDGRFVVRDLPEGTVQISAKAPGYLGGSFGQTRPGGAPQPIPIGTEQRMVAASIRLWRHAVITGLVTDERNEPAVNVQVRAMVRSFRNGQARFAASGSGRTDDRGRYRIPGLAPGDYAVAVLQTQTTTPVAMMDSLMQGVLGSQGLGAASELAASGIGAAGGIGVRVEDQLVSSQSGAMPVLGGDGRMAAYVTQYHPAASGPAEATVFTLAPGEERGDVDIRMPLVATARVRGTVLGPAGALPNVSIRLLAAAEAETGDAPSDIARSTTDANGAFQLLGVPAGHYVIKALRPARQPLSATLASNLQLAALMGGRGAGPVAPGDAVTLFADVPVSVERDVTDVVITLSASAMVSGRVEFIGTSAIPPASGVTVLLSPVGGTAMLMRPSAVGEDGRFTTPGAPAGRYLLSVTGRTPGWVVRSAMVNGIDALEQPFALTTENVGNVVVTFTDRQTGVTGTVTGPGNAPDDATVVIFPSAYREWIAKGMSARLMRSVRAQQRGAFTIGGLPAREYLIVAVADDQLPDVQNPAVYDALARVATTLTLADGDTRTVSIRIAQVAR